MPFNKSASSTLFTYNTFDFTFSSTAKSSELNTVMPTSSEPTKGPLSSSSMKELLLMTRRIMPSSSLASASMVSSCSCSSSSTSRALMMLSPVEGDAVDNDARLRTPPLDTSNLS
ncbi:hypothetical protein VNO80_12660 [Phaseolus coccineus]|uniref:Uncharacterized protein n=1 Tax=Phaseolus coccineus TaxID=3886 RepID=A0AAN9N558_PHACN